MRQRESISYDTFKQRQRKWAIIAGRTACAAVTLLTSSYSLDLAYTYTTEPERTSSMEWHGNIDCKDAAFAAVHLSSTGKDIAGSQAANNQQAIEEAGGAILVTRYDTKGDVAEFRDNLDRSLSDCATPDRPYIPVIFNGVSLGGKFAQWVTNERLKNGIVQSIIMESTPAGPDTLRNDVTREYTKSAASGSLIPVTKGMVFANALNTEISRRGTDIITHKYAMKDVLISTDQTSARTLNWQLVANAQPWPIALKPGDNAVPVEYIYSDGDSVVDTTLVRAQLQLFTQAEVTEHHISREQSWPDAPSHGDGWRLDATNAAEYRTIYTATYRKYRDRIDKQKQDTADTPILRNAPGPV